MLSVTKVLCQASETEHPAEQRRVTQQISIYQRNVEPPVLMWRLQLCDGCVANVLKEVKQRGPDCLAILWRYDREHATIAQEA